MTTKQASTSSGKERDQVPARRGRVIQGVVERRSGDKTVSVKVAIITRHRRYGKKMVATRFYLAHDFDNEAQPGDAVTLIESRPLSKRKRWTIARTGRTANKK